LRKSWFLDEVPEIRGGIELDPVNLLKDFSGIRKSSLYMAKPRVYNHSKPRMK
jgi:hypothetical protein